MSLDLPTDEQRRIRIFLSYARVDRERVTKIAESLQAAGFEVWWDALIEGGATFAKTIAAALAASDAVLVVWSQASVESDWVLDEAMHGRDRHQLIPVCIDGSQSPLGFRQYHAIDLMHWRGDQRAAEWIGTLRAIAAVCSSSEIVTAPKAHVPNATHFTRRRIFIGSAGIALAGGGYWALHRIRTVTASGNSVAVLPFRNMSNDATKAYFSDGLSEELRIALSRNNQLQVAAETSSSVFRSRQESAQSIAAKLGVAFLLDGSVRLAEDIVRIGVSLIDASTGFNRWSQTFDRHMVDIFAVQSEIADTVATTLAAQIATLRPNLGGTGNVIAFEAYLRGRALYHLDSGEQSDRAALVLFEEALAADPDYASAHAARSRSLVNIAGQYAAATALPGLYDAAEAAARRAVAIAPNLADAHSALAELLFAGRLKVLAAREHYDQSYQLGGGDADLLSGFAFYCAQTGRANDARVAITRALVLDPLNARAYRMAGWVHYAARRFAEAIPPLRKALSLNAKISNAHASIGDALLLLNRVQDARDEYLKEPSDLFRLTGLAIAEYKLGHGPSAAVANHQLITQLGDNALYQQAQVRAQWGEFEASIAHLLHARKVGDEGLLYSHSDPLIDGLRKDPRFQLLQRDLGFG